jgi:hypothetical protein
MPRKKFNHEGLTYGRLYVVKEVPSKNNNPNWLCNCTCGNTTIVNSSNLKSGNTTSCGCLHKETVTKHGECHTRLYNIHKGMLSRCYSKTSTGYARYGGNGILVADEWHDYNVFKKWALENNYDKSLTLDRIDNNRGYCPENCRWVNMTTQARNKKLNYKNTTGYFGVFFQKHIQKYAAQVSINKKSIHIGTYTCPIDAAKARDKYILANKLEGFPLNNL